MPPKKKGTKVPPAKKKATPAKRPVGRPRKELGTRVSDSNGLANVGSTKPMPRRIGRDALEQQRARLRYGVDYPGRRFTEQMTRALQDSFATGMLPYGVSLRAPSAFTSPYVPQRISGMPVGTAMNEPPIQSADINQALEDLQEAESNAASAPPRKVRRRNPSIAYVRDPNDTSEAVTPYDAVQRRQDASNANFDRLAAAFAEQRERELAEVRSASFARRRREGRLPVDQVKQAFDEALRRQNAAVPPFPAPGLERPPMLRSEQQRLLSGLPQGRKQRASGPELPPAPAPAPRQTPSVNPTRRPIGTINEPTEQVIRLRQPKKALKPEMQAIADTLNLRLPQREAPLPKDLVLRLRQAPVPRQRARLTPEMQAAADALEANAAMFVPARERAAAAAIVRDNRNARRAQEEAMASEDMVLRLSGPAPTQVLRLSSPPAQQVVVSVPDPVAVDAKLQSLKLRALELEEKVALPGVGRTNASERRELENIRGTIREIERETNAATPSSAPQTITVPGSMFSVPQSIVVPGTETPVPYAPLSSAIGQATNYQQELIRSQQEIARLREETRLQNLAMERAAVSLRAQAQLAANEAGPSRPRVSKPPITTASTGTYVDPSDLIRRNPTKTTSSGPRVGTVDAKMARGEPVSLEERQRNFQRTADANQKAEALLRDEKSSLKDIRAVRALTHLGPEQRRNLDDLIAQRTNLPLPARPAERVPVVTTQQLAMVPVGIQASLGPDVIVGDPSNPDPPQVDIPPPSNPPEPPNSGAGLQHVTAATFPASKWTTASSLRWLRSNGLHPIRKSTKINGAYSYALQSPVAYSSFNSVNMSHKNKDFTIVYGTPK